LAITPATTVSVNTTTLLTAYHDYFVKVWLEWNGTRATPAAAEECLNTLIGALTTASLP